MTEWVTRRRAVGLLGAGVLSPVIPFGKAYAAAARLVPPTGPTILRDRSLRPLGGDAMLTAERDYNIRFTPLAAGFRVEGEQISSSIDGPPELAPMLELWRKQVNTEMFPFSLDAEGLIISGSGSAPGPIPGFSGIIDAGLDMLRKDGKSEETIRDAQTFALWLQQAAAEIVTDVPLDLFVPPAQAEQTSRTIELPGGSSGTIEVRFWGSRASPGGIMTEATREVVTSTEGTSQRIVNTWAMLAA